MTNPRCYRYAVVWLLVGCIPPSGPYPSQPSQTGWQQQPAASPNDYEEDGDDSGNGNSNWWLCTAEGSIGTASGDGPWSYSTETGQGDGPTRDAAYLNALENCNALITTALSLATAAGEAREGGTCSVTDCIGPRR